MGAFTDYHVRRGGPESVSVAGGTKRNSKANAERQRTLRLAVKRKHEPRALRSEQGGCEDVSFRKLRRESSLYVNFAATYTPYEAQVRRLPDFLLRRLVCGLIFSCAFGALPARCQEPAPSAVKPAQKSAEASEKAPELPAQIELLETRVRFEANGDSHKEVHTRVHINNELGVRQFARLAFDYNRSFQQIEFPLVRITHASGGTVDILPSAITDQPNPAVTNAPAYQDVRVKSVRILGLAPADILEYRIVTSTSHHPLAPDFWLDHTFDSSGVVTQEIFELDLPASRFDGSEAPNSDRTRSDDLTRVTTQNEAFWKNKPGSGAIYVSPETPETSKQKIGEGEAARLEYRWVRTYSQPTTLSGENQPALPQNFDLVITTYPSWDGLARALAPRLYPGFRFPITLENAKRSRDLRSVNGLTTNESIYAFVSQKIRTVDLPLGATGFHTRNPIEILSSGYGNSEDKAALFTLLVGNDRVQCDLVPSALSWKMRQLARPSLFSNLLLQIGTASQSVYLDPSLEVAPFGAIPPSMRGKEVLMLYHPDLYASVIGPGPNLAHVWRRIPQDLPFKSSQDVSVDATIALNGTLDAKVRYFMRGDNELLLRVAFHQSPKEKWKEVAQLLALSDGFRGKITNVTASDPYATKEPFTVEYEITQPKFVDWSKKPVRIPALLPLVGLPDPPARPASRAAPSAIDLGTPLDVETHLILHLPAGTAARTPTGTSVERDYATFASKYQASGGSVTASRHLNFLLREISAERAADYNAFVSAVRSDEAQEFTLERVGPESSKQAASAASDPKKH